MIQELTDYYAINGILSTNFNCKFYPRCNGRTDENHLVRGKSAYVGREYENHSLPRILFVSLDMAAKSVHRTEEERTPSGVRRIEENRVWWDHNPLSHWYETHHFALSIANALKIQYSQKDANAIFAHTNSAKCCEIKDVKEMSSDTLYKNCRGYIKGEIEILEPDIIVTQGVKAFEAIKYNLREVTLQQPYFPITKIHNRIHVFMVNNHPTLLFRSVVPSWRNKRTILQREEMYPFYIKAVQKFTEQFLPNYF